MEQFLLSYGDLIRFVLAKTRKGRIVVTSTDLDVESAEALELYALRAHRNNVSLSLVALAFLQVFACMFGAEAVAAVRGRTGTIQLRFVFNTF